MRCLPNYHDLYQSTTDQNPCTASGYKRCSLSIVGSHKEERRTVLLKFIETGVWHRIWIATLEIRSYSYITKSRIHFCPPCQLLFVITKLCKSWVSLASGLATTTTYFILSSHVILYLKALDKLQLIQIAVTQVPSNSQSGDTHSAHTSVEVNNVPLK